MMSMEIKELASSPPRSGRDLQRYNNGLRLVVGCIPYRRTSPTVSVQSRPNSLEDVEVLLISSQKSSKLMFPKGGWELDEDIHFAASRETLEESGVVGKLEVKLGEWIFKSKSQEKFHKGSMFSLLVTEELDDWPEKNVRHRVWMSVTEARDACAHSWMKEALDQFIFEMARRPKVELDNVGKRCRKEEDAEEAVASKMVIAVC